MKVKCYETGELSCSSYVKLPLRSSALINFEHDGKSCFIWSILAKLHPCETDPPNKNSNYKQYFEELNIEGFDFFIGFGCSDVHILEKLNNLSINIFELNFNQDRNKWKHRLIPFENGKNDSTRFVGL